MISVCIPTYNGEKFLHQQLDSILFQLAEEDEVIISDDTSIDSTIEIIKGYNDSRIKLFEYNKFKSPIFNLENALKKAKGDFIFLADQDDVWLDGRVKEAISLFRQYDLVVIDGSIIDSENNIIQESYFKWKGSGKGFWKNFYKNSYIGCSLAFNKKILGKALPFPKAIAMHDLWIGLIAELSGKTFFLNKRLFLYRRHDNNITASIQKTDHNLSDNSFFRKITYRIVILYYILKRIILNK